MFRLVIAGLDKLNRLIGVVVAGEVKKKFTTLVKLFPDTGAAAYQSYFCS